MFQSEAVGRVEGQVGGGFGGYFIDTTTAGDGTIEIFNPGFVILFR